MRTSRSSALRMRRRSALLQPHWSQNNPTNIHLRPGAVKPADLRLLDPGCTVIPPREESGAEAFWRIKARIMERRG